MCYFVTKLFTFYKKNKDPSIKRDIIPNFCEVQILLKALPLKVRFYLNYCLKRNQIFAFPNLCGGICGVRSLVCCGMTGL